MGKWHYWLQIAAVCWGCSKATADSAAEPIRSAEPSASVLSAVPAPPAPVETANGAVERNCIDDAAGRAETCRSACVSESTDAGYDSDCKRECLAQFAREQHGCSAQPGMKPLPWFDLHASGTRPDRSELARKLEEAVLSAGTGCDVQVSGGRLPTLMLWATVDAEGKVLEASVHPIENADGHDLPACLEHELSRKKLPATSAQYSFVAPIIVPGRAVSTYSDSARDRRPVAMASRSRNLPSDRGSQRSSMTDAERRLRDRAMVRHVEREMTDVVLGSGRRMRAAGVSPSPENCRIVRNNVGLLRSDEFSRRFPQAKDDPNYEKRRQAAIREGEAAEREFCR
jgi:hypothetical protein